MHKIFIFFALVLLQSACNYYSLAFSLAIGYSTKPNVVVFKILGVINYIFWLPLGLLGHTKYGMTLEWNYPIMVVINGFLAVGIMYLLILNFKRQ